MTRRSDAEVAAAYDECGSVLKAGAKLGMPKNSVHARLKKIGHPIRGGKFTEQEQEAIRTYYENTPPETFSLTEIATSIGRPRTSVSMVAGRLGLASYHRPHSSAAINNMKTAHNGQWDRAPHPRGMLGKTHTEETRAAVSQASKLMWSTHKTFGVGLMAPEFCENRRNRLLQMASRRTVTFTRARGGRREDLGPTFFRSSWEANYARYLNLLMNMGAVTHWDYEPETFWFEGIKRGVCSYKPDFRVFYKGDEQPEYIELKGWVQAKDHTKWRRLAKYHPHIKLIVIKAKEYYALQRKWAGSIPNWESDRGGGAKRQRVAE